MAHKEINQIMTPSMEDHLSPVAQLHTLSFSKLLRRYRHEQARLLNAVESDGFFYLELTHTDSMELYKDYEQVLQIMKGWFDQPTETKTLFAYGSDVQGYKAIGSQTGALEGSRDGFETLRIAQEGLEWQDRPLPEEILQFKSLFVAFNTKTRFHVLELLSALSDACGLEGTDRFELAHDGNKTSNSSMTFHRYPRRDTRNVDNIGHNKHTDISSIAFLFAQQWGLQVPAVSSGQHSDSWDWVRPRPGYAICNIGDSLCFLSGKRFRSVVHRVLPVAEMEEEHRFSIAYFCRPMHGTMFRDSEGRMIACDEWFSHKFDIYRATHEEQQKNTVLTGGMEC
ncbi:putative 2OG-Fe(II) oxygenase family oxidoreductase [Aureobasidium pullulans]|uniref:2OG-Fe(II) oxygenase family oxidoreductase n=1 Tax=Aureobasidium pullulans TaxID=5580 RepID=A0A4S8X1L6_AURPU|nr:putative 2OG-Fe(II) oxygenase family oxidoreductase [Aureobasidium pullulans]THX19781.1 putative 2OG-Fe(II) oxygenase family oxidoreductase [Aureobasidium pullulans]THX31576.1 putative 2OG-Fe(II) oxygenase family oxidoreductase [Aureobasidium pullulans]